MKPAFSPKSRAMLKFWKKRPQPAGDPPAPAPNPAPIETATLPDRAPSSRGAPPAEPGGGEPRSDDEAIGASFPAATRAMDAGAIATQRPRSLWRERLSGSGVARGLSSLFARNPVLDEALLDELETCLIGADVGIGVATEIVERLRKRVASREFADSAALLEALRTELVTLLKAVECPLDVGGKHPFVVLVIGVNGVGKTTTIGKLARRWLDEGRSVQLAAGDTFRAAAVEQLKIWGARNGVPVAAQASGADAASVIFDALQIARARAMDVLIADTAGRLHTQSGLMDELAKIRRVLGKLDPTAPHEVLLVIDGSTGQNAIHQVARFHQAIGVTGLAVTKLDGTAKGGVVFALAREFGLPIRYIGLGEGVADLRGFAAEPFVDALLPTTLSGHG
ncbi:MAG TPA: signal recognition particle-docking protein FtsY [Rhodanobacteraceae bacterium]|nr:signal recognition particle-docking protein FtsY [Rhodanobacteraceae bacterium]